MASVASLEFCILKHFHKLFLSDFMAKNKNWPIKMCAKKSLPPPFDVPQNPCSFPLLVCLKFLLGRPQKNHPREGR